MELGKDERTAFGYYVYCHVTIVDHHVHRNSLRSSEMSHCQLKKWNIWSGQPFYNVNVLDWLISQENFPGNHHSPQDAINAFKKDIPSFYKNELEKKTFMISKLRVRNLKLA
ncbi:hypothetical protein F8M41_004422 [Gigaspora margarita]|uniref:Uncharacterized protein n=1 Tax=Gigaspora margarita TaxID=4874 RepID=A0A8H4ERX8_GIGMA|nr:hypothetical protein F8M41_004422 [Gigaspora margarita]